MAGTFIRSFVNGFEWISLRPNNYPAGILCNIKTFHYLSLTLRDNQEVGLSNSSSQANKTLKITYLTFRVYTKDTNRSTL